MQPTWPGHLMDLDEWSALPEDSEAGVPSYLLVEPGPPVSVTEFVLVGGAYERRAEHVGTAELALGVTLDLSAPERRR